MLHGRWGKTPHTVIVLLLYFSESESNIQKKRDTQWVGVVLPCLFLKFQGGIFVKLCNIMLNHGQLRLFMLSYITMRFLNCVQQAHCLSTPLKGQTVSSNPHLETLPLKHSPDTICWTLDECTWVKSQQKNGILRSESRDWKISGLQKGPAERGNGKNRQKSSKSFRHFSTIFAQGKKRQKSCQKVCQKYFRHFLTIFARHQFSGPFWGALLEKGSFGKEVFWKRGGAFQKMAISQRLERIRDSGAPRVRETKETLKIF